MNGARMQAWQLPTLLAAASMWLSGCASLRPIEGIPASRVPDSLRGEKRADKIPIDFVRLRQDPPDVYLLGPRDILGIYIEGILGDREQLPPVHFPDNGNIPPAIGYPLPVREDGTLDLPLIPKALQVDGLTLVQCQELIRRTFTIDNKILQPGKDRIIVTLMKPRTYQVVVIRQESGGGTLTAGAARNTSGGNPLNKQGAGYTLDLRAYENDVLHALTSTGGLPGLDAKNEVKVYRGAFRDAEERDRMANQIIATYDPCYCGPKCPVDQPKVTKIPIRYTPGEDPVFSQNDVVLKTGDIVVIEARDADYYYTGGLLGGGQYQIPRDYDLDVLGAIALAGGPVGGQNTGRSNLFQGSSGGLGALIPPSEALVLRSMGNCGQVPLKINLKKALLDPRERIIVQPGDYILVRYTPLEFIGNFFLSTVQFNFLFNSLLQGNNR